MAMPRVILTPEMVLPHLRHCYDFSKQEGHRVGKKNVIQYYVWATCDRCHKQRWQTIPNARKAITPYCLACKNRYTRAGLPKGKGWFLNYGYKIVDAERFYPEHFEYLRQYLTPPSHASKFWFSEHRIVALLHYGPWAVAPGMVIRHKDGNKLHNTPDNLIPGTDLDNKLDHHEAVCLMQQWRMTAIFFASLWTNKAL